jgi:hypothetical protein
LSGFIIAVEQMGGCRKISVYDRIMKHQIGKLTQKFEFNVFFRQVSVGLFSVQNEIDKQSQTDKQIQTQTRRQQTTNHQQFISVVFDTLHLCISQFDSHAVRNFTTKFNLDLKMKSFLVEHYHSFSEFHFIL